MDKTTIANLLADIAQQRATVHARIEELTETAALLDKTYARLKLEAEPPRAEIGKAPTMQGGEITAEMIGAGEVTANEIAATEESVALAVEPTHRVCPQAPGDGMTHHLRGPSNKCAYCNRDRQELARSEEG